MKCQFCSKDTKGAYYKAQPVCRRCWWGRHRIRTPSEKQYIRDNENQKM